MFYSRYLRPIRLNDEDIDWTKLDLSYLMPGPYETMFNATLAKARLVTSVDEAKRATGDVKLLYSDQKQYERITGLLRMLKEWKDGIPRGAYHMVVTIMYKNARIFIAPAPDFKHAVPKGARIVVDSTGAVKRVIKPGDQTSGWGRDRYFEEDYDYHEWASSRYKARHKGSHLDGTSSKAGSGKGSKKSGVKATGRDGSWFANQDITQVDSSHRDSVQHLDRDSRDDEWEQYLEWTGEKPIKAHEPERFFDDLGDYF